MKALWVVAVLLLATFGVRAQGTLIFANKSSAVGLDAPVFSFDHYHRLGAGYTAQIYAGLSEYSLAPTAVTAPFKLNGYFSAGVVSLPGYAEGQTVWISIRAFDNVGGWVRTWDEAVAAHGYAGDSYAFQITLGGDHLDPPQPPAYLVGMTSFLLTDYIPEPSTYALMVVGLGCLGWMGWTRRA